MSESLASLLEEQSEADVAFGEIPLEQLRDVGVLAEQLRQDLLLIAQLEAQVADVKSGVKRLQEDLLPTAMELAGMKDFTLKDGSKVKVEDSLFISIRAEKRGETFEWMKDHGHGSIVKHVISAEFGRGDDDKAKALTTLLEQNDVEFQDAQDVHWQTLRKWAKDEMAEGRHPPEELFSMLELQIATIKAPKAAKR